MKHAAERIWAPELCGCELNHINGFWVRDAAMCSGKHSDGVRHMETKTLWESFFGALKDLVGSKKFQTTIYGALAAVVAKLGWNVSDDILWMIITLVVFLVTGQGLADLGKEQAKAKAGG